MIHTSIDDEKIEVAFSVHEDYPVYALSKTIQSTSLVIKIDKLLYERYEKAQKEWYTIQELISEVEKW